MKINKNYEGLKEYNYYYLLDGNLLSDDCIEIELNKKLFVKGSIVAITYIEAGWDIEAGEGIKAGWDIEAGGYIKAGCDIEAGWSIKAGWGIKAGCDIKAGGCIKAGESIEAGGGIKAGCGIEAYGYIGADEGIEAGWGIESGTFIYCEKRIFAGLSIYKISQDCIKTIKCAELRKGEVCYGDLIITEQKGGGSDA